MKIKKYFTFILLTTILCAILSTTNEIGWIGLIILLASLIYSYYKNKNYKQEIIFLICIFIFFFLQTTSYNQSYKKKQEYLASMQNKLTDWTATVETQPFKSDKTTILIKLKNKNITLLLKPPKNTPLPNYKDTLHIQGRIKLPSPPTNPGQYNYPKYLFSKNIAGILYAQKLKIIDQSFGNPLKRLAFLLKKKVIALHQKTLPFPYSNLLTGLVFGDHGAKLPDEMNDKFQKTGLTHLLVVSGSQVSLLSGLIFSLCRFLYLKPKPMFIIITLSNIIFYLLTGGGASIFRAILMNEIALGIRLLKHHTSFYYVFALTAIIMLTINPFNLFDIGAQLSFLATFSLIYGVEKCHSLLPKKWPDFLKNCIAMSLSPFFFSAPLLWYHFQNFSPISLISNMLVIQAIECLVVVGFISTVIGLIWAFPAYIINQFCWLVMVLLTKLVDLLSNIPFAVVFIKKPHWITVILFYILLFFVLDSAIKKSWKKVKAGITICTLLITLLLIPSFLPNQLKVTFLDVGQGDATLIETPKGHTFVIDTGLKKNSFDMGKRVILPALKSKGINKIDGLIITHFDLDHIGGAPSLINTIPIGMVIDNGRKDPNFQTYFKSIQNRNIPHYSGKLGDVFKIEKNLSLTILSPLDTSNYKAKKNNNSIAIKLSYKNIDFMFTGDLETEGELSLLNQSTHLLDSEVLKLGHHGSKTSTTTTFLKAVNPILAITSAGKRNRYGHPSKSVVDRIKKNNILHLRTDKHGAIEIRTNGYQLLHKKYSETL